MQHTPTHTCTHTRIHAYMARTVQHSQKDNTCHTGMNEKRMYVYTYIHKQANESGFRLWAFYVLPSFKPRFLVSNKRSREGTGGTARMRGSTNTPIKHSYICTYIRMLLHPHMHNTCDQSGRPVSTYHTHRHPQAAGASE
jgi:hypothetical protein